MSRFLIFLHIIAAMGVVRWIAYIEYRWRVEIVVSFVVIGCLCGMVTAVTAPETSWNRRRLGWLNLGALVPTLLWFVGGYPGPVQFVARFGTGWDELFGGLFVLGLMFGVSLLIVRPHEKGLLRTSKGPGILVLSAAICALASVPWVIVMAQSVDSYERFLAWRSSFRLLMEIGTIFAIALAGLEIVKGSRFAAAVAIVETLSVPLLVHISHW